MEVEIFLPSVHTCFIEISLSPKEDSLGFLLHPNLIHIAVKKKARRTKKEMSEGVKAPQDFISVKEWRLVLKKVGNQVTPVKLDQRCIFPEDVSIDCIEEKGDGVMVLKLGPKHLNATIVQTLLKPEGNSISVQHVLNDIELSHLDNLKGKSKAVIMKNLPNATNEARIRVKMQTKALAPDNILDQPGVDILSQDVIRNSKCASTAPINIHKVLSSEIFCQNKSSSTIVILKQKVSSDLSVDFVLEDQNENRTAIPQETVYTKPTLPRDQIYHGVTAQINIPPQDSRFIQSLSDYRSSGYNLSLVLFKGEEHSYDSRHTAIPVNYVYHGNPHCCNCSTGLVETKMENPGKKAGQKRNAGAWHNSNGKRANVVAYPDPPSISSSEGYGSAASSPNHGSPLSHPPSISSSEGYGSAASSPNHGSPLSHDPVTMEQENLLAPGSQIQSTHQGQGEGEASLLDSSAFKEFFPDYKGPIEMPDLFSELESFQMLNDVAVTDGVLLKSKKNKPVEKTNARQEKRKTTTMKRGTVREESKTQKKISAYQGMTQKSFVQDTRGVFVVAASASILTLGVAFAFQYFM